LWIFGSVNLLWLIFRAKLTLFPEGDDCANNADDHELTNVFGDIIQGLR
jgi:hypothetical protein